MDKTRPDPEHLLQRAAEEERLESRGKLKIYLGAAPGVGKTHEMLHDALEKRQQGLDVVIGIAESHGREEIQKLLTHFEVLERQKVPYRDKTYLEFDLDAALQRHPGLILVDEAAHSNAAGLRHAKRWQDIQELLDRGIDVYTTLNVQHIESLKDDVAQIIHAPIMETVPDLLIEQADTIELIDLPPEDLLKRLQEGKIYFPKQIELAKDHFFRKGNLIALRELALRVTAERVGSDILLYRKGEGIKEIWPVKEKILVCVGPRPETLKLIRAAKKLATSLQASWLAVYIDAPQSSISTRNQAIQNLRLAERLGAETRVLTGFDIVDEIMEFAREQNVTQIMIWKQIGKRWKGWFGRSLADEIIRYSDEINVSIMTGKHTEPPVPKNRPKSKFIPWKLYGFALIMISAITGIGFLISPIMDNGNLIMLYLLGVTSVALFGRRGPSVLASVLSVLAYDFFFIPPYYTFAISDIAYFLTLLVMLIVTQIISHLTILIRNQAESARFAQHQTTALYAFSRQLIRIRGTEQLLEFGADHIANIFDSQVMALIPQKNHLEIKANYPSPIKLETKEFSIAQWVYDMGQPAGLGTDTLSLSNALYLPLLGFSNPIGVFRIQPKNKALFTPEQRSLLGSYVNQMSLALEIDLLYEKNQKKELEVEKDKVCSNLLVSIYHDLNFPLQSVINAVNNLRNNPENKFRSTDLHIAHEVNKLSRLNNNLYQIIQIEAQGITLKKTRCSFKKLIQSVIQTSNETFEVRPFQLTIPDELPQISMDSKRIQEVLLHLLDNAIKFSIPNSPINLTAQASATKLTVGIKDFGLGIDRHEKKKLFKKFYRSKQAIDEHGLGLGLTICKKIIAAHNGTIWVENLQNKGAAFYFTLPIKN